MKRIELTYDEAVADLRAVIAEQGPEHAVEAAAYFHSDGSPCCLLGHVLKRHGIGYEDLCIPDPDPDPDFPDDRVTFNDDSLAVLLDQGVLVVDGRTKDLLLRAQLYSDSGLTWGLFNLEE